MKLTETQVYVHHRYAGKFVAEHYGISLDELVRVSLAIGKKENRSFNTNAKNPASSARGLMQMLVGTQKEIETKILKIPHEPDKIFDPTYAVYLGQIEIAKQLKKYKNDWDKAIHAYNRGSYNPASKGFKNGEAYRKDVVALMERTNYAALDAALQTNA
jgi:hypothetical protein